MLVVSNAEAPHAHVNGFYKKSGRTARGKPRFVKTAGDGTPFKHNGYYGVEISDFGLPGFGYAIGHGMAGNNVLQHPGMSAAHPPRSGWVHRDTGQLVPLSIRYPCLDPPIVLETLGGDQFPVHGCFDQPAADFKAMAMAQHPEDLGPAAGGWRVALPGADAALPNIDLGALAEQVLGGADVLSESMFLVWDDEGPEPEPEPNLSYT